MLKISKLTDYATIILIHLDQHKKTVSSSLLAVETGIPEPTVAKVLKMLTRASLVKSCRGAGSGYFLEYNLEDISLSKVISIIDGPIELIDCNKDSCRITTVDCQLYGKWDFINVKVKQVFEKMTLADLKQQKAFNS